VCGGWVGLGWVGLVSLLQNATACNFIVRATIKQNEWGEGEGEGEHDWREIPLMGEFQ